MFVSNPVLWIGLDTKARRPNPGQGPVEEIIVQTHDLHARDHTIRDMLFPL